MPGFSVCPCQRRRHWQVVSMQFGQEHHTDYDEGNHEERYDATGNNVHILCQGRERVSQRCAKLLYSDILNLRIANYQPLGRGSNQVAAAEVA